MSTKNSQDGATVQAGHVIDQGRGILKEFREFAIKGSVVDLAVGIIIGAAFNSLVQSLVNNIIMPIPGALIGGIDFANYFIPLNGKSYRFLSDALADHAPVIQYGVFINNVINFLIVAWVVFLLVRAINGLRRQAESAPKEGPKDKECPFCHTTIPIKAIRCPNCTSDLKNAPQPIEI